MTEATSPATIKTPDQRLRVFISSTLQELAAERQAVAAAVRRLRLSPVMFELGARPHPPRELYRAYLAQSHVFIGLYHQRYGWVAPGERVSGLEDEYRLSAGMPRLVYLKTPAPEREPRLEALLELIRQQDDVSYRSFSSPEELAELVENDLALLLSERFEARNAVAGELLEPSRTPLPHFATALVGRQREIEAAVRLLETPAVRLLTLTGPGGIGKTRLAVAVAERLAPSFADGVVFVPLAAVLDPALLLPSLASALGERDLPPSVAGLASALGEREVLVLLDNFEQLADAAPVLSELLQAAPRLKLLVSSRARLRLLSEHELAVPPLALPASSDLASTAQAEAVALFVARAQAVKPDFTLSEANASAVVELCRRLDGLPLAIELAAARSKLFSPGALLERLSRPLELGSTARDLPERQRTLRHAIAWSYQLLDDAERRLYRHLGVFAGGATLEAIEAVAQGEESFERLASLVDKSLLALRTDGLEPRFTMLQTLRSYALEQLEGAGEADAVRARHLAHFTALAVQAEAELTGPQQQVWMARIESELDNIRAALRWGLAAERAEAVTLAAAMWRFWLTHGDFDEGRRLYAEALPLAERVGLPALTRARALNGAGSLALGQGDYLAAQRCYTEALELMKDSGNRRAISALVSNLGACAEELGDYIQARRLHREGLALARELGDTLGVAYSLNNLGNVAKSLGELDEAQALYRESLALLDVAQDKLGTVLALNNLGETALLQDDPAEAKRLYEQSLALAREVDNTPEVAAALGGLGAAAYRLGAYQEARRELEESLAVSLKLQQHPYSAKALRWLAALARSQGRLDEARRHLADAVALLERQPNRRERVTCVLELAALDEAEGALARAAALLGALEAEVNLTPLERQGLEELRARLGDEAWRKGHAHDLASLLREAARPAT